MINPTQLHRLDGAISARIAEIRRDMELQAASVRCRSQLTPIGLDQQGRHETRDQVVRLTLTPDEQAKLIRATSWFKFAGHAANDEAKTTDGMGFEAAYVRPIGRAERVMMRAIEQATPIRIALAITYLAALSVVAGVVWGGWQ